MTQAFAQQAEIVFRRHPLRTAMKALVLTVVLSAAALFILPSMLPRNMDIPTRGLIVLVVAIVLTAVVWIGMFWYRNIRVVIRPDRIDIGRPGDVQSYARAMTGFRSKVTEHHTNGIRTSTTRTLIVDTGAKETLVDLHGFSRAEFNELMAVLAPIGTPTTDPVDAARLRAHLVRTFTIDASSQRRIGTAFLVVAVVFLTITVAVAAVVFSQGPLDGEDAVIVVTPFTGLVGVGFGLGALQRFRAFATSPRRIEIGSLGLRIDDVDHPYSQLRRIWLTPPAYPTHRMQIDPVAGRSRTIILESNRVTLTPAYDEFLLTITSETGRTPGLLSLDLE